MLYLVTAKYYIMDKKKLQHPPIREAIIDIKIAEPLSGEDFEQKYPAIQSQYPDKKAINVFQASINSHDQITNSGSFFQGYQYFSEDKKQILQFQKDGFTFNRLSPYPSWNDFVEQAKKGWEVYSNDISSLITRLAIRTINEIHVPYPLEKINDFFNLQLVLPSALNFSQEQFNVQSILRKENFKALINFSVLNHSNPSTTKVLLDIDLFCDTFNFSATSPEIFQTLSVMRELKNSVFFSCLTERLGEILS